MFRRDQLRVDLPRGAICGAGEDTDVGRKRQRDPRQIVDCDPARHRDGGRLNDVGGALPDDVASHDPSRRPLGDQLAEAVRPAIDDRPDGLVEARTGYIKAAYAEADATLGLALGLVGDANVFVTSDHGFAPAYYAVNAGLVLQQAGLLDEPQTGNCRTAPPPALPSPRTS